MAQENNLIPTVEIPPHPRLVMGSHAGPNHWKIDEEVTTILAVLIENLSDIVQVSSDSDIKIVQKSYNLIYGTVVKSKLHILYSCLNVSINLLNDARTNPLERLQTFSIPIIA